MRMLMMTASISRNGAGVSDSVRNLSRELAGLCRVEVVGLRDAFSETDADAWRPLAPELFERVGPRQWGYSPGLKARIGRNGANVIHAHGLWMYPSYAAAAPCRRKRQPLVISPHGMLEPWALNNSKWKKRIAGWVFQDKALRIATCLHATAEQEYKSIREYGLPNPVAVIPVGVDIAEHACGPERANIDERWPQLKDRRIVLFMSRIHPKKGLLSLAHAWGNACRRYENWQLVIAGPDANGHEAEVRRAVEAGSASLHTTFVGPVYGVMKKQLLAACDFFVLPTFSENFGIVVAEALASGKPVLTTKGAPWEELQIHRCGWWIDIGVEPLEAALREAMQLSDAQRREMGLHGRNLVKQKYTWPQIAAQMIEVYKWVLGEGPQPDCVRID